MPGIALDEVKKAQRAHRRLLRRQHRDIKHSAKGIFDDAAPLSALGDLFTAPYVQPMSLNKMPLTPLPPKWFDKMGERTTIVPVYINGKEVARAVAKDTADELARK
jgi:hypothetical protein